MTLLTKRRLWHTRKKQKALEGKVTFPVKVLMPYNSGMPDWANRSQVVEQQIEKLLGTDYVDIIIEAGPSTGFYQRFVNLVNLLFLKQTGVQTMPTHQRIRIHSLQAVLIINRSWLKDIQMQTENQNIKT